MVTEALFAALVVAVLVVLYLRERDRVMERREWAAERAGLLDRVQAPGAVAAALFPVRDSVDVDVVPVDDLPRVPFEDADLVVDDYMGG